MSVTTRRIGLALLAGAALGLQSPGTASAEYPGGTGAWTWGGGGSVHFEAESFGLQGKGLYGFNEQFRISPSATLFFDDTWLSLDGDLHYVFPMESDNPLLYVLGGLEIATDFDWAEVGLNLGAGINTRLSDSLGGYLELKYVISDLDGFVISFGVLF